MFTVGVSDHIMIAHSFADPAFGPAQRLHGATYAVEVELFASELDRLAVVVDIGLLKEELRAVLARLDYQNLDELPEWKGRLSTTEAVAQAIHQGLAARLQGRCKASSMRVLLRESP